MAKPTRARRFVAISCNHGGRILRGIDDELMRFCADFKPDVRLHLGDNWDTTAWRNGAGGTSDEADRVSDDWVAGVNFMERFKPHVFFEGNHDCRPRRWLKHPNALAQRAAELWVRDMEQLCKQLRCERVEYDVRRGWRLLGPAAVGHGFMFAENAVRDHVEMLGQPVLIGHLHRLHSQVGRCLGAPVGYCVGTLSDIDQMDYASTRRATTAWGNGWAYGEYTHDEITVHLHRCRTGSRVGIAPLSVSRAA
jgi:hypothetical protein